MKQITSTDPFKPRDLGVGPTWGLIVKEMGDQTPFSISLEIATSRNGPFEVVATFDEGGTYLEEISRDHWYRIDSPLAVEGVFVL